MNQDALYQECMSEGGGGVSGYLKCEGIREDEIIEY